ncbi:MAG: hypothetical protein M3123_02565, partial [Actinomycetota bacterium]|nr:hypothetical protein [Actinomycetota bacterium]
RAASLVGGDRLAEVERVSLELYAFAAEHAAARGIILADTKFEFGLDADALRHVDVLFERLAALAPRKEVIHA